jgi:hypothetical protein
VIAGKVYFEHGQPVTVVAQWARPVPARPVVDWLRPPHGAPRNVLIERAGGGCVVRPFRGLRREVPHA